jgi:hypothetical protein
MKQGKPPADGYALELQCIRDPHQAMPIMIPLDVYPTSIKPSTVTWRDGMRTILYDIKKGTKVIMKHIFTCNLVDLQAEPTSLFRDFQMSVQLRQSGNMAGMRRCFAQFSTLYFNTA